MTEITGLGHVGIFVSDADEALKFYTSVLGLIITDRMENGVFLSFDPEYEHHQIVLATSKDEITNANRIAFPVGALVDLKNLYSKIRDYGCTIESQVNRGSSLGFIFQDPVGNRLEIYWETGIDCPLTFSQNINLDAPEREILSHLDELMSNQDSNQR